VNGTISEDSASTTTGSAQKVAEAPQVEAARTRTPADKAWFGGAYNR
jgi:hypothetical protein